MRLTAGLVAVALAIGTAGTANGAADVPDVTFPNLVSHSLAGDGFVPEGWKLERTAAGDLNGDGRPDLVLLLRCTSAANVVQESAGRTFDTNPRLLAVAFAAPGGGYDLVFQNHTLVPRPVEPNLEDAFAPHAVQPGGIEVKNGALRVTLGHFETTGGTDMGQRVYTFRYRHQRFELIGYDSLDIARATGDMHGRSVNFITRRVKLSTNNIASNAPDKVTWRHLPPPLPTFEEIGNGYDYDPTR